MVKIKAKYKKRTTLFGRDLVGVRSEIEKSTYLGTTLVRIKSEIEKNTFLVGLWLGLGQK